MEGKTNMQYDVFISYSRKDYIDENNQIIPDNAISKIKKTLTENGISYWFDEDGIYHGDTFAEKIATNIEKSSILLFLSSENSNTSKWTSKEIAAATQWKKKIIPVRLDKSPYNKSVMLYISDLDFVEYYKNTIAAQKAIIDSIKNCKEEIRKAQILEEQKKESAAKEKRERERVEKRRIEQAELCKEINDSIQIVRHTEDAIEEQRLDLKEQISSLDNKADRKHLFLLLDQSNPSTFDERAKSRSLLKEINKLNEIITNYASDEEIRCQEERNRWNKLKRIYLTIIICIICCSLAGIFFQRHASKLEINILKESKDSLSTTTDSLSRVIKILSDNLEDMRAKPLKIISISIKNKGEEYDETIYSSNTTYLYPRLNMFSLIDGEVSLYIKIYKPDGQVYRNDNSPKDYTYESRIKVEKDKQFTYYPKGYGNTLKGSFWKPGNYKFEFYYEGICIGSKSFTVYEQK